MDDAAPVDPFADGILEPEEIRGSEPPPVQPFSCASCGLGLGDDSEPACPACGADLTQPGALVRAAG